MAPENKITFKLVATSTAAGLAMALPFLHSQAGWLSLGCLLPFLYLVQKLACSRLTAAKKVFIICLSGFFMMAVTVYWLPLTDTSFLSGLSGWVLPLGLFVTYLIFVLCLSSGFILLGYVFAKQKGLISRPSGLVLIPAVWVVSEWLRSWPFSIVMHGPEGSVGPYWNFGSLGFALSNTPAGYSSRLVGLYGLSFLVVLINLGLYRLIKGQRRLAMVGLGLVAATSAAGYLLYASPAGKPVQAAALQIGSSSKFMTNQDAFKAARSELAGMPKADIIVLPEHSAVFEQDRREDDKALFQGIARTGNTPVITSRDRQVDGRKSNTLTVYKPDSSIIYEKDKSFLIPIGEDVPYLYEYLYAVIGRSESIHLLRTSRQVAKSETADGSYVAGSLTIASSACSAAIHPEFYRKQITQNTEIITNSASLSMFDRSAGYHVQSLQMMKFISVSNAKPFVQSTKGGASAITDHNGKLLAASQSERSEVISSAVMTNQKRTLYTLVGEWVLWLSFTTLAVYYVKKLLKHKNRESH